MRLISFLFLLLPMLAACQTKKATAFYDKAVKQEKSGNISKAKMLYLRALEQSPDYIDPMFQLGATAYDNGNYVEAYQFLGKALELKPALLPKIGYQVGKSAKEANELAAARKTLEAYMELPKASPKLKSKAERLLAEIRFQEQSLNYDISPVALSKGINTKNNENGPSLTADGNTMVFTRETYAQEDLWISEKVDGEWMQATLLPNINTERGNEGAQCISPDGTVIVFTACGRKDGYGGCDLYLTELKEGSWTKPTNIDFPVNDRGRETQPTISPDNKSIIFASNRAGGFGKLDLYLTTRDSKGKWSKPVNLGPSINTSEDDRTPFWHPDGETLYFSSKGHIGHGGHDLYRAKRKADGTWGDLLNLGTPINTAKSEGSLIVSLDGKQAYYTTYRELEKHADIFVFDMPTEIQPLATTFVKAKVIDKVTKDLLEADVLVKDLKNNNTVTSVRTSESGSFLVCLPIGKQYSLNVNKAGYTFGSENFDLEAGESVEPKVIVIELTPVAKPEVATTEQEPTVVVLNNIFFESGSAELLPTSFAELNQLVDFLTLNQTKKIEIQGHTDSVGSDADNLTLSQSRAESVVNFLVEKGITSSRLKARGFGESSPVASNDTPEGRKLNRRTAFQILN